MVLSSWEWAAAPEMIAPIMLAVLASAVGAALGI
jgi:hypothetical protein